MIKMYKRDLDHWDILVGALRICRICRTCAEKGSMKTGSCAQPRKLQRPLTQASQEDQNILSILCVQRVHLRIQRVETFLNIVVDATCLRVVSSNVPAMARNEDVAWYIT